ncbi:ALDH-like protein [Aspergillus sclerotiicarbonarius CBS 121057]|uniref:ALDH-like protein n=1 Tax=Aspergillus sclerotiicarbonarius (strain CBS 121057 / IBT 28362) TaxID=1448318 RepID=A0A319F5N9_ASPSB|nr:ALDH-like protein [Aspergillus sclerotiicarbonarius CBS 121057]
MGNIIIWKPSDYAIHSNHLQLQILLEAGLPPNVIQFLPGNPTTITDVVVVLHHPDFAEVFRDLYSQIATGVYSGRYTNCPRIVGETGGKNFAVVHATADIPNAVTHTIRGAFEYQPGPRNVPTSRNPSGPNSNPRLVHETDKFETVKLPVRTDGWFVHPTIFQNGLAGPFAQDDRVLWTHLIRPCCFRMQSLRRFWG